jgi:protoporphyrinogen oxidase
MCISCGYNIQRHFHEPYLEYLYAKLKEALSTQDWYREQEKTGKRGEISNSSMIRKWGEEAMRIQSKIQMSRDAPSDFTEEADTWMRREKLINAQFEAIRGNAPKRAD